MLHYQTGPRNEIFVEAHNDYLQLAAEGGLMLGIPILITLGLFVREVWLRFREGADDERTYWLRAGAVTGLIAIAIQEVFDFTLQMPGAAVLFVVLAAIAIHKPDYLKRRLEANAGPPEGGHYAGTSVRSA
jgi:O-antigen ligase